MARFYLRLANRYRLSLKRNREIGGKYGTRVDVDVKGDVMWNVRRDNRGCPVQMKYTVYLRSDRIPVGKSLY